MDQGPCGVEMTHFDNVRATPQKGGPGFSGQISNGLGTGGIGNNKETKQNIRKEKEENEREREGRNRKGRK